VELPEPARELLRRNVFAHVATVSESGWPQVTLVWVDEDEGHLMFNAALGRVKITNLTRDPRVVVTVQDPDQPVRYLRVTGRARLTTEGADEVIDRLSRKYSGQPFTHQEGQQRVTVHVIASRVGGEGPWVAD
jgi:PPOX class probable F420-dependent enzyme